MDESDAVFGAQICCPIVDLEHADMVYEWLFWNGEKAEVSDLDSYVLYHRRRMKPCTSTLALKLANAGCGTVDCTMVRDQPHSEADYPGEVCRWIDAVCDLHNKSLTEPR